MILIIFYLFVLGTIFGSFILVVVDRMRAGKDWVRGRSKCEFCKHTLSPSDLIPLLSWLFNRGKCRYCSNPLSVMYPIAELGLGLIFILSYIYWPIELNGLLPISMFIIWLISTVLMWGLLIYDLRWYLLPNKFIYPLQFLSLLWAVLYIINNESYNASMLLSYGLSVLVSAGLFYVLYKVSNGKWIGFGDVRFGVVIGLFTGNWLLSWMTIFIASVIGIVISLPLMYKTKNKKTYMKLRIPFGPMLITSLIIVVVVGQRLIDWYVSEILIL